MPTLNDVDPSKMFAMFKGEPGTRKSTQAMTWPGPQYWFSTDRKMSALALPAKKWGIDKSKINYDDYSEHYKLINKLEQLRLNCPFRTVIIDSVTLAGLIINKQTRGDKKGSTNKSGEESGRRVGGIAVNTMEDYKAEFAAFQEIMSNCQDMIELNDTNVILIAHVVGERKSDEVGVTAHARIIITGGKQISGMIPAVCREVYHFDITKALVSGEEGDYRIFTSHTGEDFARTALPLPREIKFKDQQLYPTFIEPAIKSLMAGSTTSLPTTNQLTPI